MKKIVRSPGSATIVNAIATGYGSAFGINLDIIAKGKLISSKIKCSTDVNTNTNLMELSAKEVINYYGVKTGVDIDIESKLPQGSGLSSSSALSNSVVSLIANLISEEFGLKSLTDEEIINLAIDASLKANVTITGAYDDATASYFGGITVTNNLKREIIIREKIEEYNILIYMPDTVSLTADSNVKKMKLLSPLVNVAFDLASKKEYFKALTLNGLIYSASLGFDAKIALDALENGALASGLSGTGSAFVAISNNQYKDDIFDVWSSYPGKVLETQVDNIGTKLISK
ncbi:MAG: shikimate kinase [Methanobrevibacter sp.]|nr:shikimate kinase [Candidatus Methanovirga meridionalis]